MPKNLPKLRVGHGFDVHAFADERKLILGGIEIPFEKGLLGHSDADVLLHAVIDALLGALSLGDIGTWFPDTAAENKDIDSALMFQKVWQEISSSSWQLLNCDTVVMAQAPKLAPHVPRMRERLASLFEVDVEQINVKATTTERLGFVGRKEGIAASATVLLAHAESE